MWEMVGAMTAVIAVVGGGAVTWIKGEISREGAARQAASAAILTTQNDIKDDIKAITDTFDKRVDRLEQKSSDYRSGTAVDAAIEHSKRNTMMAIDGVKQTTDRNGAAIDTLRDRVTVLETRHESTATAVNEVKNELKDTRHEINDRLDQMAQTSRAQFDQLCVTIREMSTRQPKP